MPSEEKKGITVKIDAGLHTEVRQYLELHNMTMAEFVTLALDDELHPKLNVKEDQNLENIRTIAFQVPEDLFQRIKEYLQRNHMTQRQFLVGLIENELERDLTACESLSEAQDAAEEGDEEIDEQEANSLADDFEGFSGDVEETNDISDEEETEDEGMSLSM